MKKLTNSLFVILAAGLAASLAVAGEKYVGTVAPATLNVYALYDAGTLLADGGCPTDGGGCVYPKSYIINTAPIGGAFAVQPDTSGGSVCYCVNQVDPGTQLTNCTISNCIVVPTTQFHETSCPQAPAVLKLDAGTYPDGGRRWAYANDCTFFNVGDAGAKLFNLSK